MHKCPTCGIELPEGVKFCPPKIILLKHGRTSKFKGCYSLRADTLVDPKGGRRIAPKYRSDQWLKTLAKAGEGETE